MLAITVEQRVQQYAQVADGRMIAARWRNTAVKKGRHNNGVEALDADPGCAKSFRAKASMHALAIVSDKRLGPKAIAEPPLSLWIGRAFVATISFCHLQLFAPSQEKVEAAAPLDGSDFRVARTRLYHLASEPIRALP